MLLDNIISELLRVGHFYVLEERGGELLYQFILANNRHFHQYLIQKVEVDDG